jgi:hypothetical protein
MVNCAFVFDCAGVGLCPQHVAAAEYAVRVWCCRWWSNRTCTAALFVAVSLDAAVHLFECDAAAQLLM